MLGLTAAVATTRLLETVLFEVRPIDAQVYVGVVALIAVVTVLAACVPALRAARVEPLTALRQE